MGKNKRSRVSKINREMDGLLTSSTAVYIDNGYNHKKIQTTEVYNVKLENWNLQPMHI